MYARHFDLRQDPFSIAPDPHFLFMSERHREALAHLLFGVTGTGGFVLFTGDIGTGKTTVCRCFLDQIPAACNVGIVFNPKLSVRELLQTICEEFHVVLDPALDPSSLKSYVDALNAHLLHSHAQGQSNVLIIDEAQNLLPDVLEQLRLLTNLETHERKLLQIVLIGQPELRDMLAHPKLEQLAQRVIARYHLEALNAVETTQYIQHRMSVAGHHGPLPFDASSLRRIHSLTRGVPRRINLLCGRALLGAWASGRHQVDRQVIAQAAAEVFAANGAGRGAALRHYAAPALGAVAVLCLAWALALTVWPRAGHKAAPSSTALAAVAPAPAPLAAPAAALPAAATAPVGQAAALEDLQALLAAAPRSMPPAWRELGTLWKLDSGADDPCQAAERAQLQCYRAAELTIPLLRQLDRPGILTLQKDDGPVVYAVLAGLNQQAATLRWDGALHRIPLTVLVPLWHGEFATLWQPPPAYRSDARASATSSVYAQLSDRLALLEGKPAPTGSAAAQMLDAALVARVKAFQASQGLKPDGHPGPMTFMQLERALGSSGPSLQTGSP